MEPRLIVIFEHPQWQQPLFSALEKRGIAFETWDLKRGHFGDDHVTPDALYFSQASPSAYLRGNTHAVPWGLALLEILETRGSPCDSTVRALFGSN